MVFQAYDHEMRCAYLPVSSSLLGLVLLEHVLILLQPMQVGLEWLGSTSLTVRSAQDAIYHAETFAVCGKRVEVSITSLEKKKLDVSIVHIGWDIAEFVLARGETSRVIQQHPLIQDSA